ncbi:MAG: undecaprenyldiphospho-muramoylpentapeptide beta-N-acetylglucosaminyltransferase [Bacilli bacterium]|nr:undecaprenyldiphospho-muramoylpentapeptide beta-N-acetylglucosaminyltransferase [Bacilli bacterium]
MKIIVTAGGTGGHIYPALAIINKFKEKEQNLDVLYIGTHNRMEKDIVPNHGIKYEALEIYGFSKTEIVRDVKNIFLIKKAYKKCLKLMQDFKPDVVIGVGGYVTYPVIKAAHKLGIKTFIHEQNSIPGKSNLALAKKVDLIGVSFPDSKKYFKNSNVIYTGNPCSENAINTKAISPKDLGFQNDRNKLIVFVAGSLGSSTLNEVFIKTISKLKDSNYNILFITGNSHYEDINKLMKNDNNLIVKPFIDNLSGVFKNTDLVITRAGASTISELLSLNVPAIYIPSPYVANNHQYYNALDLQNKNLAIMIEEKNLNADILASTINKLLKSDVEYNKIKNNLNLNKKMKSSETIYNEIKKII